MIPPGVTTYDLPHIVPMCWADAWFTAQWHAHEMSDLTPLLPPPCL